MSLTYLYRLRGHRFAPKRQKACSTYPFRLTAAQLVSSGRTSVRSRRIRICSPRGFRPVPRSGEGTGSRVILESVSICRADVLEAWTTVAFLCGKGFHSNFALEGPDLIPRHSCTVSVGDYYLTPPCQSSSYPGSMCVGRQCPVFPHAGSYSPSVASAHLEGIEMCRLRRF